MSNKTCGECRFLKDVKPHGVCEKQKLCLCPDELPACAKFEQKTITNGDVIRQGGDDALIDFADGIRRRMCHYCAFSKDKSCVDKTGDCWEGVRAWLDAPADCVKQNGNDDTQTDLCKSGNTESEGEDEN